MTPHEHLMNSSAISASPSSSHLLMLCSQCKKAWDIEPNAAVDESRLRLASRFCSFVVTMLCKPIKVGLTIYCCVLESGYLYDWVWFTGAGQALPPQGQPTDEGALDEDDAQQMGFVMPLVLSLMAGKFVGSLCTVYLDKVQTPHACIHTNLMHAYMIMYEGILCPYLCHGV